MTTRTIIGSLVLLMTVACGGDKAPPAPEKTAAAPPAAKPAPAEPAAEPEAELPPQVARAARLASAIDADPEAADQILEDNQMNREDLDSLMFEIAADADLSAAYQQARAG